MVKQNKGLGRGLDALLSGMDQVIGSEELRELDVTLLRPGKYQPRTKMDEASLDELAASIKAQGVIQPIVARQLPDGGFEIIAGERRWRASQRAGLSVVPVLVRDVSDNAALAMALIENIQRENLNSLEEAQGIQRLIDEFSMTHQEAADAVGRSRSTASNLLRLLNLPEAVQDLLMDGHLDMGHARALLPLDEEQQIILGARISAEQMSVRQAEKLVKQALTPRPPKSEPNQEALDWQAACSQAIGTPVEVRPGKGGAGKLVLNYSSLAHLDELLSRLKSA